MHINWQIYDSVSQDASRIEELIEGLAAKF